MQTHVTTPIEGYHFTPFASALMHLPMAINKVVGSSQIFYEYKGMKRSLDVTIYYRRKAGHNERIGLELTRTAYSFAELENMVRSEYAWADHFYNHRDSHHETCSDCTAQFKV